MRRVHIISGILIVLTIASGAQAKAWRGIIPLKTTRADVERVLGSATVARSDLLVYEYSDEKVYIDFSRGPCSVEYSPWNVPRDVVISVLVMRTSKPLNAADLNLSQEKFTKTPDNHRPQIVYYTNEDEGIEYSVDEGEVWTVRYFPSAVDMPLRCPEPRNRLSETIRFARYSNITLAAEKRILNRFAQLIARYTSVNYASAEAYILVHRASRGRQGEATARAERAKQYLVIQRHIDPDRIEILNAGDREKLTIELYLVPPGTTIRLSLFRGHFDLITEHYQKP